MVRAAYYCVWMNKYIWWLLFCALNGRPLSVFMRGGVCVCVRVSRLSTTVFKHTFLAHVNSVEIVLAGSGRQCTGVSDTCSMRTAPVKCERSVRGKKKYYEKTNLVCWWCAKVTFKLAFRANTTPNGLIRTTFGDDTETTDRTIEKGNQYCRISNGRRSLAKRFRNTHIVERDWWRRIEKGCSLFYVLLCAQLLCDASLRTCRQTQ